MIPLAQLRAEIVDTQLRTEILFRGLRDQLDPLRRGKAWASLALAVDSLQRAADAVGGALADQLAAERAQRESCKAEVARG